MSHDPFSPDRAPVPVSQMRVESVGVNALDRRRVDVAVDLTLTIVSGKDGEPIGLWSKDRRPEHKGMLVVPAVQRPYHFRVKDQLCSLEIDLGQSAVSGVDPHLWLCTAEEALI